MVRTEEIPAGKHAGKHRESLNASFGKPGGGEYKFKHVFCGACEKQYKAYKTECPRCGGGV